MFTHDRCIHEDVLTVFFVLMSVYVFDNKENRYTVFFLQAKGIVYCFCDNVMSHGELAP